MRRRHERLEEVSPEVGALDASALAGLMEEDLDEGVSLLIDLSRATDPALRASARRLAPQLLVPAARVTGRAGGGGSSRFGPVPAEGVDLDIDATLEQLGRHPRLRAEDLRWRGWRRPGRALVLLVDASGSVDGPPLATALVTAAALTARTSPADELAVVAFSSRTLLLRHLHDPAPPAGVLNRLLALRGGDTTDLAGGLSAALAQVAVASCGQRDVVLLSDGMANEGSDPVAVASSAPRAGTRVHVLALSGEADALDACRALAAAGNGRMARLARPADAPGAVAEILR